MFTPAAFLNRFYYLDKEEDSQDVSHYKNIIRGEEYNNLFPVNMKIHFNHTTTGRQTFWYLLFCENLLLYRTV